MQRMPTEIGADVDNDAALRRTEKFRDPPSHQGLVRSVLGDMPADGVTVMNEKGKIRFGRADTIGRPPWHHPCRKEGQCTERLRNLEIA